MLFANLDDLVKALEAHRGNLILFAAVVPILAAIVGCDVP